MSDEIAKLGKKLFEEFGVTIKEYIISDIFPPTYILKFPTGDVTNKLRVLFSENTQHTLQGFLIQSEMMAKHNQYVFPFVSSPTAEIISEDPFLLKFTGVTPLAYCFVYILIAKISQKTIS